MSVTDFETAKIQLANGWTDRHWQSKYSKMVTTVDSRWWVNGCSLCNSLKFSVCLKIFILKYWEKYTIEKINKAKSWFLEKIHKIANTLIKLIKKKGENTNYQYQE